jgi:hypothetical protein
LTSITILKLLLKYVHVRPPIAMVSRVVEVLRAFSGVGRKCLEDKESTKYKQLPPFFTGSGNKIYRVDTSQSTNDHHPNP